MKKKNLNQDVNKKASKSSYNEMKDEIAELIKPIAVHEAKSAVYKAKLAGYVLHKGAKGLQHGAGYLGKKAKKALKSRKKHLNETGRKAPNDIVKEGDPE